MSERHPYPYQCEGEDCPLCLLESEIERLTAELKELATGNIRRWEQTCADANKIERLTIAVKAAKLAFRQDGDICGVKLMQQALED